MSLPPQGFASVVVNDVPEWAPAVHEQLAAVPVIWHDTELLPQVPVHTLVAPPVGVVVELLHSALGFQARYDSKAVLQLGSATTCPELRVSG